MNFVRNWRHERGQYLGEMCRRVLTKTSMYLVSQIQQLPVVKSAILRSTRIFAPIGCFKDKDKARIGLFRFSGAQFGWRQMFDK